VNAKTNEALVNLQAVPRTGPSAGRRAQMTIQALERHIDTTVAHGGRLIMDVLTAQAETDVPATATQAALEDIHASIGASLTARKLTTAAHAKLGKVAAGLNLTELGWGDYAFKAQEGAVGPRARPMRIVPAAE
jgi:hypothetical protein